MAPPLRARSARSGRARPARDPRSTLSRRALDLVQKIESKDRYGIFLLPVDADAIPDYRKVVARPMDLSTVRANVSAGVYLSPDDLRADLDLIWANCIRFNSDESIYYKEAVRLRALAGKYFEEFLRNLARDGVTPAAGGGGDAANGAVKPTSAVSLRVNAKRLRGIAAGEKGGVEGGQNGIADGAAKGDEDTAAEADEEIAVDQFLKGPRKRLRNSQGGGASTLNYAHGAQARMHPRPRQELHGVGWRGSPSYQDFVSQSGPAARRLLAIVLDPFAVRDHDDAFARMDAEAHANAQADMEASMQTNMQENANDALEAPALPTKRPRSPPSESNLPDAPPKPEPIMPMGPPAEPPSPRAVEDLRKILKSHKIDDAFLNAHLPKSVAGAGSPGDTVLEEVRPAGQEAEEAVQENGKAGESESDSDGSLDVGDDAEGQVEADSLASGEEASPSSELDRLLQTNHANILNLLRVRALKEGAVGEALEGLQAMEEEYARCLRDGVAMAAEMFPPSVLIPRRKAEELSVAAAKEFMSKKVVGEEAKDGEAAAKEDVTIEDEAKEATVKEDVSKEDMPMEDVPKESVPKEVAAKEAAIK